MHLMNEVYMSSSEKKLNVLLIYAEKMINNMTILP